MGDENSIGMVRVLLPVYNEAAGIATLLERIRTILRDIPYSVLVVEDGSTDGTHEQLSAIAATMPIRDPPAFDKPRPVGNDPRRLRARRERGAARRRHHPDGRRRHPRSPLYPGDAGQDPCGPRRRHRLALSARRRRRRADRLSCLHQPLCEPPHEGHLSDRRESGSTRADTGPTAPSSSRTHCRYSATASST